jgi:peptidoglycan-associated lipoprotein
MIKVGKAFLMGLAVVALVMIPACKPKKPAPKVVPPEVVQPSTITIPPPPVTTTVEQRDFVKSDTTATEPVVKTDTMPTNIEDVNRVAQQRGYVQDAFFSYNESALTPEGQGALTVSANWLKQNPQYNILIEGHCDERGTEQYNLALGDRRANIAREYLMTLGVDGPRIRTVSYGEERPFDPGHDDSAWAKNRRAHLVIVGR